MTSMRADNDASQVATATSTKREKVVLAEARRRLLQDVERYYREHLNDPSQVWSLLVHSDYEAAFKAIRSVPRGDGLFLEWGSGLGTITLMAAMLGYRASGIEIWP